MEKKVDFSSPLFMLYYTKISYEDLMILWRRTEPLKFKKPHYYIMVTKRNNVIKPYRGHGGRALTETQFKKLLKSVDIKLI